MAKIKIEDVLEHLDSEVKRALESTIREVYPSIQDVDRSVLFRAFIRGISRACNFWESVPDHLVER
jgi:hypothetical protein